MIRAPFFPTGQCEWSSRRPVGEKGRDEGAAHDTRSSIACSILRRTAQHRARPPRPSRVQTHTLARPSTDRAADRKSGLPRSDDAHHRLQQLASVPRNKIHGVRRDWVFATKLLASATMTAHHLPHILGKLVCAGSLVASKRNRLWIASRSSVHAASLIHAHGCLPPHPQPFSPVSEDEHNSPPPTGEKGAILQKSPLQIAISTPRSIGHRAQLKFHAQARSWTNRPLKEIRLNAGGVAHRGGFRVRLVEELLITAGKVATARHQGWEKCCRCNSRRGSVAMRL